jgi:hypothetical protein
MIQVQKVLILLFILGGLLFGLPPGFAEPPKDPCPSLRDLFLKDSQSGDYTYLNSGLVALNGLNTAEYLVMRNKKSNVMVLIVDAPVLSDLNSSTPLLQDTNGLLASTLFTCCVRFACPFKVTPVRGIIQEVDSQAYHVTRLKVSFDDGFVEPDIITQFYPTANRHVMVMLGQPSVGSVNGPHHFETSYRLMESENRLIISRILSMR